MLGECDSDDGDSDDGDDDDDDNNTGLIVGIVLGTVLPCCCLFWIAAAIWRRKPKVQHVSEHRGSAESGDLEYLTKWRGKRVEVWEPVGNVIAAQHEEKIDGGEKAVEKYWEKYKAEQPPVNMEVFS